MMDGIDELGVTYDELYKVHTGHYLNRESDENDSSDDSGSLDENLKPPLYTLEELNTNLFVVEEPKQTENIKTIKHSSEKIAKELLSCILAKNCLICKKAGGSHYIAARHYKTVRQWLQNKFASSGINAEINNFFCEVCNLPLSGNDLAQKHYESAYHKNNVKSFCLTCLRAIPEQSMPSHLKSKNHITKQLTNPLSLTPTKYIKPKNTETISVISMNDNIKSKWQNSNTAFKKCQDLDQNMYTINNFENVETIKNMSEEIAKQLLSCILENKCLICKKGGKQHYLKAIHYRTVRRWLQNKFASSCINAEINSFFCEACNLPLSGNDLAQKHYESAYHNNKAKSFCLPCLRQIPEQNMPYHLRSKKHINKQATNSPRLPTTNVIGRNDKIKSKGQKSNTAFKNIQKDDKIASPQWPKKLADLITVTECRVCNTKVPTVEEANLHYESKQHNLNVTNWIDFYNQFVYGPVSVADANFKKFQCPFCNSVFKSEQEFDNHKNIHFPALGGTRASDTRKKLNTRNVNLDNTFKQEAVSKEGVNDKTILGTLQKQKEEQNMQFNSFDVKPIMFMEKQEIRKSRSNEENKKMYDIQCEVNKLLNTLYISRTLPFDQSLAYLKNLNKKLTDAKHKYNHGNSPNETIYGDRDNKIDNNCKNKSTGAVKKSIFKSINASHNDEIMGLEFVNMAVDKETKMTKNDYAKIKLSMEIDRLKKVLGSQQIICSDLAKKHIKQLNQILEASINSGINCFDINNIFESEGNKLLFSKDINQQSNLDSELYKVTNLLLDINKINAEEALDFITQYNLRLENFLHYHSG